MKTKPNLVLIIAGVAFVAILSLFIAEGSFSRIQRAPVRNVDFTEVILPVSKETAVKKIAAISIGIEGIDRGVTLKGKFADFWLADFHDPIFPEAYWLRANSQNNPALQRYADTSPASRKEDFYLFSPLNHSWLSSEYFFRGKPAEFTCDFIIHLEDAGNSKTKLEVIEYRPTVTAGKRFEMPAHGLLPGFFRHIEWVQPTTEDREELLNALRQAVEPNW